MQFQCVLKNLILLYILHFEWTTFDISACTEDYHCASKCGSGATPKCNFSLVQGYSCYCENIVSTSTNFIDLFDFYIDSIEASLNVQFKKTWKHWSNLHDINFKNVSLQVFIFNFSKMILTTVISVFFKKCDLIIKLL